MIEERELHVLAGDGAFCTQYGECAWSADDLPRVLGELAEKRFAILSGEVWIVEGSFFSALPPRRDGGFAIFAWQVQPREFAETWSHFVFRSVEETLDAIRSLNVESEIAPEASGKVYYHLRCVDQEAMVEQGRRVA